MTNGFLLGLGSLTGSSRPPVGRLANPDSPSPWLHPHYRASSLLRDGPSLCPASVLCPSRSPPLGGSPSRRLPRASAQLSATVSGRQVLTFRMGACRPDTVADNWADALGRHGRESPQAEETARGRVPMRGTGTDRLVVATKPGNAGGAKGTGCPGSPSGQPEAGRSR